MSPITIRRAAASAATAAALLGGALSAAPAATAAPAGTTSVKLVKCRAMYDIPNFSARVDPGGANLRTGPGKKYRIRTVLQPGTKVRAVCLDPSGSYPGWTFWYKVQVKSGHFKGRWGWVHSSTI